MSQPDRIAEAARWILDRPREERARPVIVELRERFGLTAGEACRAIEVANLMRESTR